MAWIKLETHTFEKVEIFSIAQELNIDPDAVVGKCARVWAWFDLNTVDGVTPSVTEALLDRYCGVTGFCKAMVKVGWMGLDEQSLFLPNYDRHNSQTAKDRALTAKRVSKSRKKAECNGESNAKCNGVSNGQALASALDREDKKREDNIVTKPENFNEDLWKDFVAHRKSKKAPITQTVMKGFIREADKAGISLEKAITVTIERNWQAFKADWFLKDNPKPVTSGQYGDIFPRWVG